MHSRGEFYFLLLNGTRNAYEVAVNFFTEKNVKFNGL